jgi:hypothetical protein
MALVIEELECRGARRIGFLGDEVEDSRQDFGWLGGIDLYRHRGGQADVSSLLFKESPSEKAIRSWMKRLRLEALIVTQGFFGKTSYLEGLIPRASLDVPMKELHKVAGLYQNSTQIGRHTVRSLAIRLVNGILGLPDHPFSVVSQASFVEGESIRRLAKR